METRVKLKAQILEVNTLFFIFILFELNYEKIESRETRISQTQTHLSRKLPQNPLTQIFTSSLTGWGRYGREGVLDYFAWCFGT